MTIGKRINGLRKTHGYSQEYIAQQLGVSRQAVSKWEQDICRPDTDNLIGLASLLNASVQYIAAGEEAVSKSQPVGKEQKKLTKKQIWRIAAAILTAVIISVAAGTAVWIYTRPVDWDTAACGGGYVTYIYDKYSDELTRKFLNGMGDDKENVVSIEAIRGSQSAQWEDKTIFLQFDIRYEHKKHGTVSERIHFIGKRLWIDTFDWSGAIIEG